MFNRQKILSACFSAFAGTAIGVPIADTIIAHKELAETFYTVAMEEGDKVFHALGGQQYTEHFLWRPFSEGQMLSTQEFNEDPFAAYNVTYRNHWLSYMTGVRYVTSIEKLDRDQPRPDLSRFNPA